MTTKKPTARTPFRNLSPERQRQFASRLFANIRAGIHATARGKYAAVTYQQDLRRRVDIEHGNEDEALTASERARLLGLARGQMRNGETLPALLKQFDFNVVGTVGGKASFGFGDGYERQSEIMKEAFAKWAAHCEFFRSENLGRLLKLAMRTMVMGGDTVLVFDDGAFADSGKVLGFESDNIANIPDGEFTRRFPEGYSQSQGFIYDQFHRLIGCFVSPSQRGVDQFELYKDGRLQVLPLIADPALADGEQPFVIFANTWRFNQGRGTTPLASSLGSMTDLEDLSNYEVQSAKWSAQKVMQVLQTEDQSPDGALGDLDPDQLAPIQLGDEEALQQAIADATEGDDDTEPLKLDHIDHAGAIWDLMPPGLKGELLSPEHPNAILPEFVKWLQGRSGWTLGVGAVYATGKADRSYTAFRGEQVMSWPAFEDLQHELETKILDWVLPKWYAWACRHDATIAALSLPERWQRTVRWNWPRIREVNQVDEQNAAKLALMNYTKSYRDLLGPDYFAQLTQVAKERRELEALGLPDMRMQTANGQILTNTKDNEEEL